MISHFQQSPLSVAIFQQHRVYISQLIPYYRPFPQYSYFLDMIQLLTQIEKLIKLNAATIQRSSSVTDGLRNIHSQMAVDKKQTSVTLREHLGSASFKGLVFCFAFLFFLFCPRPVPCVPNVACISGLSILDCPIRFSLKFPSNIVTALCA